MRNFNQKDDYTKATNSLSKETICNDIKPADVPFEKYRALERENEALKDAIIKLTLKVMGLEKALHPDVW